MKSVRNNQPSAAGRAVYVETYGCQMNTADSLMMAGILEAAGHVLVDSPGVAEVILLNTCAVRQHAEERVIGRLNQLAGLKVDQPELIIGVCGCMAKHLREGVCERAPAVDLVVGPDSYRELPALIQSVSRTAPLVEVAFNRRETYDSVPPARIDGVTGWLPIQRGCDRFCSFCVVPYVRGRERSSSPEQVLRQARELEAAGAKELNLLGQTVNSYQHGEVRLAELLERLSRLAGIERLRFTSPYPLDFDERLIDTLKSNDKVMPYLHLPLQSGSDEVLRRMNRGYSVSEYERLVEVLRAAVPGLALSTDLIVGYPGEDEEAFALTLSMVEAVRFDFAFMFYYSERAGTVAHRRQPDELPMEVKKERLRRLIEVQESISRSRFRERIGSPVEVLVTGRARRDPEQWVGRSEDFKTTVFRGGAGSLVGRVVRVRVKEATSHTLIGEAESGS